MHRELCQPIAYFFACLLLCSSRVLVAQERAAPPAVAPIPPIKRVLPPEGIEVPDDVAQRLKNELAAAYEHYERLKDHELAADIEVFLKAVRYAIELREFYTEKDFAKADALLKEANQRMTQLASGKHPWTRATGTVVRGYRSTIDDSAQPYGVVIPQNFNFDKPAPLYVWLHGRGDKSTDLHFITERMTKPGQITPPNAIVVHAFGRQCVGYKNAGEVDIAEVRQEARRQYKIDDARCVLIGFSMGGAGAWHVGAHSASRWRVIAPGAGFAETARYQKLKPEDYPPWYEQKLWGQNDTPAYVRNLFNTEVIAYSGELDRQIQAARVMEEAYQSEGRTLTHLIGPKTEHKYEPKTLATLLAKIDDALKSATSGPAKKVSLQTRTLAYASQHWVEVQELEEHWRDTRVDGVLSGHRFELTTKNVAGLLLSLPAGVHDPAGNVQIKVDGQELTFHRGENAVRDFCVMQKSNGRWNVKGEEALAYPSGRLIKRPMLQGPIDDAFCRKFVVVLPSGRSRNPRFQAWQEYELDHFRQRWQALMRGDLREKRDREINEQDIRESNLILWGDEDSNSVIKRIAASLPIRLAGDQWEVGREQFAAATHVPVLIYPNPLHTAAPLPPKYVVLNSGLTFREAHDRTNSLQNPKLPDWAMIDITQPPDAAAPGKVVNAGFFNEQWQLKPPPK